MKLKLYTGDCVEVMNSMKPKSVNLTVGSPPYHGKMRRYGSNAKMTDRQWAAWMTKVVIAAIRVTDGPVVMVANGCVQKGIYKPSVERMMVMLSDLDVPIYRPAIWFKNAPPTTGEWFCNTWEYCCAFGEKPVWNWESIATAPKYKAGGNFRQRNAKGDRVEGSSYPQTKLTRPRDVLCIEGDSPMLKVNVGGGQMGHKLAHENEAPYPEALAEPFVLALSNPGDPVLDPFCGSGTTLAVALKNDRKAIGIDNRESQTKLTRKRLKSLGS